MSAVPPWSDLDVQAVPSSARDWVSRTFNVLNEFARGAIAALNKGLTFGDNFNAQVITQTLTPAASNGPSSPLAQIGCTITGIAKGVLVLQATDITSSQYTLIPLTGIPDWSYAAASALNSSGKALPQLKINSIPGLTAGRKYSVTLVILGG